MKSNDWFPQNIHFLLFCVSANTWTEKADILLSPLLTLKNTDTTVSVLLSASTVKHASSCAHDNTVQLIITFSVS